MYHVAWALGQEGVRLVVKRKTVTPTDKPVLKLELVVTHGDLKKALAELDIDIEELDDDDWREMTDCLVEFALTVKDELITNVLDEVFVLVDADEAKEEPNGGADDTNYRSPTGAE